VTIYLVTLCIMLLIVAAMAVGVMMGRKPIAGSCGGLNAVGLNGECKICGRTTGTCEEDDNQSLAAASSKINASLGKPAR